ncbi:conserved proline-rich protein [Talaromyces stipitatus ATCC 10500]|uniref:Conserved proline-rich protein n=1 Tax=Talaromyces stipitatus (strain ATCC 10500 / CBS 375.48 / QM 6759 / NRRL 1006) TaxID=441959 RepID=B8M5J8_TALSN|nr:conserved proline-rich protein [Talaromyces stipitatus ATCC 10500]EED19892.1 conserved proline-rich protein [Talaromyces stipitatus ATCC 10500]
MAAKASFQLFPSPVKSKKNPFRTIPAKEEPRSKSPIVADNDDSIKAGIQTESVIIKIIEDTNTDTIQPWPVPSPDASHSEILPDTTQLGPQQRQKSPVSPGKPINSIFPQYNPQLPLNKQAYFPQNRGTKNTSHQSSSSTAGTVCEQDVPPTEVDAVLGPKTVPASVFNFPSGALSPRIQYSSAEELVTLWESANGQELQESLGTFNLRAERVDTTAFTFGDPQLPFYTLNASMDGFSLLRNHPLKRNRGVQVMVLNFENPARRQPPHNGLVTVIFSKLAAMLAIEQAAELTRHHSLAPSEAMEVETNAVNRAAAQESCRLIWNALQHRYELQHPSLLKQHSSALVGEDGNPLPRVQTAKPGILHITVSPTAERDSEHYQPPVIMVTSPRSPNSIQAGDMEATPRTSTLPQADIDEPLASLDLSTMTLSICAGLTTSIIPSLYAIDSLIAAMLAVAVTDESTWPVLANTELYVPGLESPRTPRQIPQQRRKSRFFRNSVASTAQKMNKSTYSGKYFTTFAEREEAEEEAKLMAQIHAAEAKERSRKRKPSTIEKKKGGMFSFLGSGKKKTDGKTKQIIVEEFDLEKYGHFGQGSSREGQELPGPAKMLVNLLVLGLQVVVTILSAGVKCAVWMVVNVTRCVTSEKF